MKVIIIGAGEVGYELAESIRRKGHDVIIVDKSEKACRKARALDVKVIKGNGARPELLGSLDIASAGYFFSVTNENETNLVTCSMAKSAGCKTIARINGLEYISKPISQRFSQIGVDYAVSPELIIAKKIANIISVPSAIDRNLALGGKINVVEFKVIENSRIDGKKISSVKFPPNVNLGAIIRGNKVLVPHGDNVLKKNDNLIAMVGSKKSEKKMIKLVGKHRANVNRVLVIGATSIGINVSKILDRRGISVKLMDDSSKRCRKAAEELKNVEVVQGDARNKKVLIEEGILRVDALGATTNSEEFNVLVSLLAKVYGVEKTVAVVRELGLKSLIETVGIDLAASPELQTAKTMLRIAKELNPLKAISIHGGDLYILEMMVSEYSMVNGEKLKDCDLPVKTIVGAIKRGDRTLIPGGNVEFREGDHVIIFVEQSEIVNVEELF